MIKSRGCDVCGI